MRLLIITQVVDSTHPILGFFHRWLEEFAQHCKGVIVICLYEGTHNLPKNVRVLSLGKESGVSRLKYLKRFFSYIWNERKNYDAVFVHMNQVYVLLGGLFWRLLGKRVALWYAHGSVPFSLLLSIPIVHTVFTSTKYGFRVATRKRRIVGQGIDLSEFSYHKHNGADTFRLITVGRISPVKHLEILIDAVALMHSREAPCIFTIVGDADGAFARAYKYKLIEQVRGRDLESAVTWKGSQPHNIIAPLVGSHDVFLHASRTGSLDKTVLEALAVGTLPVTCDATLAHELPDDLKTVCVVSGHDVKSYVRALMNIRALSDTESSRLRTKGREYVAQNHSIDRLVPRIMSSL